MPHADLRLNEPVGDEVKTTTCYMCACRCGIKVHLKDGRVRYIQGNPAHPVNKGVLCAKGSAGIMQHYSPARLHKPLLRIGERGAGEFLRPFRMLFPHGLRREHGDRQHQAKQQGKKTSHRPAIPGQRESRV